MEGDKYFLGEGGVEARIDFLGNGSWPSALCPSKLTFYGTRGMPRHIYSEPINVVSSGDSSSNSSSNSSSSSCSSNSSSSCCSSSSTHAHQGRDHGSSLKSGSRGVGCRGVGMRVGLSGYRGVEVSGCRGIGVLEYRDIGVSGNRGVEVSVYRCIGLSVYRGIGLSGCRALNTDNVIKTFAIICKLT